MRLPHSAYRLGLTAVTAVVFSSVSHAQAERPLKLPPANATLAEEFTVIGSVRELSDGRVLITDPRDGRVVVADLKTGAVIQVGRKGKGPNEYENPGPLIPLAADSSLLSDFMQRRWLLFSGPAIVATLPPDTPIIKAVSTFVRGADGRGNVWTTASPHRFNQETAKPGTLTFGPADSDFVVRANRATARLDTVTKLRGVVSRQTVTANAEGKFQSVTQSRPPLTVGEEAALFGDGWFAIARLDPYRVDWISPEGRVTRGRPIPVTPIKVTAAEKEAYFARQAAARAPRPGMPALPEALRRELDALRDQFPGVFPPFTAGPIAAGDGTLWLRRPVSMNFPDYRYDVVDRRGQLVGVVSLAKGERIITVSATAAYVVWKDADDIERLRRHPLFTP
jgi:hypothetical protein